MMEDDIKRWTAKRKAALVMEIIQQASRVIGDWIGFYNHQRPHQALKMKTPAQTYEIFKLAA